MKDNKEFEIHIADDDITSGMISIAWCITPELVAKLKEEGISNPHVVIVITSSNGRKEQRSVVPLTDLMTYITFLYPGKNKIHAFISGSFSAKHYLSKYCGQYETDLIDKTPTFEDVEDDGEYHIRKRFEDYPQDAIEVEVPQECFAKEPSESEKRWLDYIFTSDYRDQCSVRRKRILAYTFQPFILVLDLAARLVMGLVALLFCFRNLKNYRVLFKPLTFAFHETFNVKAGTSVFGGGSIFISKKKTSDRNVLHFLKSVAKIYWTGIFMPLFSIPIVIAFTQIGIGATLFLVGQAVTLIIAAFLLVILLVYCLDKYSDWSSTKQTVAWYEQDEALAALMCGQEKKPLDPSLLPKKKRTFRLRYQKLKAQVCKPYAG